MKEQYEPKKMFFISVTWRHHRLVLWINKLNVFVFMDKTTIPFAFSYRLNGKNGFMF